MPSGYKGKTFKTRTGPQEVLSVACPHCFLEELGKCMHAMAVAWSLLLDGLQVLAGTEMLQRPQIGWVNPVALMRGSTMYLQAP